MACPNCHDTKGTCLHAYCDNCFSVDKLKSDERVGKDKKKDCNHHTKRGYAPVIKQDGWRFCSDDTDYMKFLSKPGWNLTCHCAGCGGKFVRKISKK